jgi:magnesium transporter
VVKQAQVILKRRMKTVYKYKDATWVDLFAPTSEEINEIVHDYGIDAMVAHELTSPSLKYRVETKGDHVFLIIYFPSFKQTASDKSSHEIDFIVGKDYLITVRYDEIDAVERFAKRIEVESILDKETPLEARNLLFFGLLKELTRGLFDQLSYIDNWIKEIEARIFAGKEKEMVSSISEVSKNLLAFRKIFFPYAESMKSLEVAGQKLFGEEFAFCSRGVAEEFSKCEFVVKDQIESLSELRETNNSLLSTKQNEIMKILTIMAFVTFPLTLITSIFGMEMDDKPLVGVSGAFWIILGMMGLLTVCFFIFFKYKKWL